MTHVRFERSDAIFEQMTEEEAAQAARCVVIGPVDWVQLTYAELRLSPDGESAAEYDGDYWWPHTASERFLFRDHFTAIDRKYGFSDVVVY